MIGAGYALLALGFTLIFGVMRRLNLSFGPSIMLGTYCGAFAYLQWNAPVLAVALATIGGAIVAGLYVEALCFSALERRGADVAVASMAASFAVWMQLEEAAVLVLPKHVYPFPALASTSPLAFGPWLVRIEHLVVLAGAIVLVASLQVLLYRTRFGLGLRLLADHPAAARAVGIPVRRLTIGAFVLASAIGGAAGFLLAGVDQQITPMAGMWSTMKGLVAMMLGGLGSIPGAIAGGLLLGIVEANGGWYLGPQLRDLLVYGLLFAFLVLRPQGLLGARAAVV
jgi:branched-chain amino acid transport system permease protein